MNSGILHLVVLEFAKVQLTLSGPLLSPFCCSPTNAAVMHAIGFYGLFWVSVFSKA